MKTKKNKPMSTVELVLHSPSPIFNSLRDYKPKTYTPLKFKKKYKDSYKKELREYY